MNEPDGLGVDKATMRSSSVQLLQRAKAVRTRLTAMWMSLTGGTGRNEATVASSQTILLDDASIAGDPHAAYRKLREEGPLLFLERHQAWIVLDHALARSVLTDTAHFSNSPYQFLDPVMLGQDPPDHGPVRRAVARLFNARTLAEIEELAADTARRSVSARFDIVADLARVVARRSAIRMIGLADSDAPHVEAAEDRLLTGDAQAFAGLCSALDDVAPRTEVFRYFRENCSFSQDQARSLTRLLWLAATATTERTIAQAMLALLRDPELDQRLRSDRNLMSGFVDEVVRLSPPETLIRRRLLADTSLNDLPMKRGADVFVALSAANRDPAVFETPDQVMFGRVTPGLGFGAGIHACVGGPLSRRVIAAAIGAVLDATESITSDLPVADIPHVSGMMVHTPRRLPVAAVLRCGSSN